MELITRFVFLISGWRSEIDCDYDQIRDSFPYVQIILINKTPYNQVRFFKLIYFRHTSKNNEARDN